MKKKLLIKKTTFILIFLLVIGMAACSKQESGTKTNTPPSNEPKASAEETDVYKTVVATVNGEKIYKSDFLREYESMYSYYSQSGYAMDQEGAKTELKVYVIDMLVKQKVLLLKAKEQGLEKLSKETTDQINKQAEDTFQSMKNNIRNGLKAQESGSDSSTEDKEAAAGVSPTTGKEFEEQVESKFRDMLTGAYFSEDSYKQYLADQAILYALQDKFGSNVTADEDEIKKWYDDNLKIQKEAIDKDNSAYKNFEDTVHLYKPQGIVRVLQILIKVDEEKSNSAENLYITGKEGEAIASLENEFQKIQSKADEVLAKAKKGEDFAKLMKEYNEDKGLQSDDAIAQGYTVIPGLDNYLKEFTDAALALKKDGDISGPVKTYYGYHIIKRIGSGAAGPVPLEEVKDKIKEIVLSDKKAEIWEKQAKAWVSEANVVYYHNL